MGEFLGYTLVFLFLLWLAKKMGYVSFHKKEDKPKSGSGKPSGPSRPVDMK